MNLKYGYFFLAYRYNVPTNICFFFLQIFYPTRIDFNTTSLKVDDQCATHLYIMTRDPNPSTKEERQSARTWKLFDNEILLRKS